MTFYVWFLLLSTMFLRLIHVVSVPHSFVWLNNISLYVYATFSLSKWTFGLFPPFGYFVNNAAVNICVQVLSGHVFNSFSYITKSGSGAMWILRLTFCEAAKMFSTVATQFYIPTSNIWVSFSPYPHQLILHLKKFSHGSECEVASRPMHFKVA